MAEVSNRLARIAPIEKAVARMISNKVNIHNSLLPTWIARTGASFVLPCK